MPSFKGLVWKPPYLIMSFFPWYFMILLNKRNPCLSLLKLKRIVKMENKPAVCGGVRPHYTWLKLLWLSSGSLLKLIWQWEAKSRLPNMTFTALLPLWTIPTLFLIMNCHVCFAPSQRNLFFYSALPLLMPLLSHLERPFPVFEVLLQCHSLHTAFPDSFG